MLLARKRRVPRWAILLLVMVTLLGIALIFSRPLGNNLTAGDAQTNPVSRATSFSNTLEAAADYFPTGSGIGSFPTIYPMYEDPQTLTTTYVNHAHSDLIELALETGLPGLLLLALFLIWWARRALVIWRADEPDQFARAATIATGAILAHSLVDYPLRTAAISALFAACCALMTEPRPITTQRESEREGGARHLTAD
jgi:O-antigen ligase